MTPDQYIDTTLRDLADVHGASKVLAAAKLLFEPPIPSTPSRVADPDTSHASGEKRSTKDVRRFSNASMQARLMREFSAERLDGLTALAAAMRAIGPHPLPHRVESARKRVSDLARAGYIVDSLDRRANPGSEEQAVVWKITALGIEALRMMNETGWTRPAVAA